VKSLDTQDPPSQEGLRVHFLVIQHTQSKA